MAGDGVIRRWVRAIFDAAAAKKTEQQFASSLETAGKTGGANFVRELKTAFATKLADLKVSLAKGLIDPKQFKTQADLAAKQFNAGVIKGMEEARAAGTITNTEYLKLARTLKSVGDTGEVAGSKIGGFFLKIGSAAAGFFALSKVEAFLADSVHSAIEAQNSASRLDVVLGKLGLSYRLVSKEVEGYLDDLQQTTRFGDEDAREALVNLITITGDYRKSLSLLSITADIASKRGTSMAEAAQTAGDASRGLTKGMKDLGVGVHETGDIVQRLRDNLGGLAKREGSEAGGQLTILKNLLGEVKESFGDAIIGGDGFTGSISELRKALVDLNAWVKDNKGEIRGFVNLLVIGAKGIGQALAAGGTVQGGIFHKLVQAQEAERKKAEAADVEGGQRVLDQLALTERLMTEFTVTGAKTRAAETEEERKLREARERVLADELFRIETELGVRRLQIEHGFTEALAREMVRQEHIRLGTTPRSSAGLGEVEKAWGELGQANIEIAAGFDQDLTPAIARTEQKFLDLAAAASKVAGAKKPVQEFQSTWKKALGAIATEIKAEQHWFAGLGDALVEGGLKALPKYFAAKAKQNIAEGIEAGADALFALAIHNYDGARKFGASAGAHFAAAAAFGAIGGASGGFGGGSGGDAGGSASGPPAGFGASAALTPVLPDINLFFNGPSVFNPEFQKQIRFAASQAEERFGPNAKITIYRNGKP